MEQIQPGQPSSQLGRVQIGKQRVQQPQSQQPPELSVTKASTVATSQLGTSTGHPSQVAGSARRNSIPPSSVQPMPRSIDAIRADVESRLKDYAHRNEITVETTIKVEQNGKNVAITIFHPKEREKDLESYLSSHHFTNMPENSIKLELKVKPTQTKESLIREFEDFK